MLNPQFLCVKSQFLLVKSPCLMLKPLCSSENVAVEISHFFFKNFPNQNRPSFYILVREDGGSPHVFTAKRSHRRKTEAQVLSSTTAEALAYQL